MHLGVCREPCGGMQLSVDLATPDPCLSELLVFRSEFCVLGWFLWTLAHVESMCMSQSAVAWSTEQFPPPPPPQSPIPGRHGI